MLSSRIEVVNDALVITPDVRRLDALVAGEFRQSSVAALGTCSRIVVVLSNVKSMDSSGLGALVSMHKTLPPGGKLLLVGAQPAVRSLLQITRLDKLLPVFETVAAALAETV